MIISPIVGMGLGFLAMTAILWAFRNGHPGRMSRNFRRAQTVSAAAMALGHGLQDAAKTMGIVVLALVVGGWHEGDSIPLWVTVSSALVISAGTYAGGWRIMRTLGRKIIDLDPPQGFAAESVAASVLYIAGLVFHAPISTTHTITSAIMGVGATRRPRRRAEFLGAEPAGVKAGGRRGGGGGRRNATGWECPAIDQGGHVAHCTRNHRHCTDRGGPRGGGRLVARRKLPRRGPDLPDGQPAAGAAFG